MIIITNFKQIPLTSIIGMQLRMKKTPIKVQFNTIIGIWFAMLCHKGCKPDKVYEALSQL